MFVYVCVCKCVCVYVCMYVCMYGDWWTSMYIYVCMYGELSQCMYVCRRRLRWNFIINFNSRTTAGRGVEKGLFSPLERVEKREFCTLPEMVELVRLLPSRASTYWTKDWWPYIHTILHTYVCSPYTYIHTYIHMYMHKYSSYRHIYTSVIY